MEDVKKYYKENAEQMIGATIEDYCRWVGMAKEYYLELKKQEKNIDKLAVVGQDIEDKIMAEHLDGLRTRYTLGIDYANEEIDPEWFVETEDNRITLEEWTDKGIKLFGTKRADWKFKCPSCGRIQSAGDFVKLGFDCVDSFVLASHDCYGVHNKGCGCNFKLDGEEVNKDLIEVVTGDVSDKLFPFYVENAEDELTVGLED